MLTSQLRKLMSMSTAPSRSVTCWWRHISTMSVALVFTLLAVTSTLSSGSRGGSGVAVSPTVVCLRRGYSYAAYRRQLSAAFFDRLKELNRNLSFAFRPAFTLSHRIVELSEFSPPEVCLSHTFTIYFAASSHFYTTSVFDSS